MCMAAENIALEMCFSLKACYLLQIVLKESLPNILIQDMWCPLTSILRITQAITTLKMLRSRV